MFAPLLPWQAPWDPSSFNFYKASPLEFVLSYTPSFRHERDEAAALKAGLIPVEIDAAAGQAKAATLGALRGADGERRLGSARSGGDFPLACAEVSTAAPPQDAVLVNIRPVGAVSLLLTPGYAIREQV